MNELPPTSGGTSVQTGVSVTKPLTKSPGKFKERTVKPSKPGKQQSVKAPVEASGRTPSSGDTQLKLQDRNTGHTSDDGNSDPKQFDDSQALDQVLPDSFDDAETASQASEDSAVFSGSERSEVEDDQEDLMSPDARQETQVSDATEATTTAGRQTVRATERDEGFEDGVIQDPGSGDVKTETQTPAHSATSPEVQHTTEAVISPPNTRFPVPVDSKTDDATITISNTGADNDAAINGDETITIEGGGKVNKGKFLRALKAIANWFMGLFDNKIAVGLAVFFALTFLFGLLASPAGAPLVFLLMAGLAAAITCGSTGLLIADLAPDLGQQQQQQPNNSQNPNQQNNNQSDNSSSEIDKTKSGSGSSQPGAASTDANDTDGSFFLTPNGKKAPAPVINGGSNSSARDGTDAASATGAVDAQLDKMFGTEAFDEWLNENLLRWSNKAQFAEFSKTLRGRDDYKELAMDDKLDSLLEDLHRESNDLSYLAHSPLEELDSSGPRQFDRLDYFNSSFDRALELLDPTPEHCQTMFNRLMRVLPKEQFPWVSSNLYSPLLSIGDQRKSLEAQPNKEITKAEVSDMLRIALRRLDSYGKGGELQKESEEQEKRRQVQTVKRKRAADPQDGKPPEKVRVIKKESSIEATPVETNEKGVQVGDSDSEFQQRTDERHKRVLNKFGRSLDYEPSQLEIPQPAKKATRFIAFFTNVKNGIENWDNQEKTLDKAPANLSAKQFQKLVVMELGKAVFRIGTPMMEADNAERSKEDAGSRDSARLISIDTHDGRKAFLERIFESQGVHDVFTRMEASDSEQAKAREYLKRFIH